MKEDIHTKKKTDRNRDNNKVNIAIKRLHHGNKNDHKGVNIKTKK